MRKIIIVFLSILMLTSFYGCTNKTEETDEKISIVTTTFPLYDWIRNICDGNENVEVSLLLNNNVDLHNYQPTIEDITKIINSDLFVYVGGESDEWIEDVVNTSQKDLNTLCLFDELASNLKLEEEKKGMQEEDEHNHEEEEYDEHIWLSLKNAILACEAITEKLIEIDNNSIYQDNLDKYKDKLEELDNMYKNTIESSKRKILLFADRFPFRYLVDDYGLDYYAAFKGCSAESEASFETVAFLSGKLDELQLPYVLVIDTGNGKIAEAIINNSSITDREICVLNSMQSKIDSGDYLSIMKDNLEVLRKVLN